MIRELRKEEYVEGRFLFIEEKDLRSSVVVWMKLLGEKIM